MGFEQQEDHLYALQQQHTEHHLRVSQIWHDIALIQESIPQESIRPQVVGGKIKEYWGIMAVEGLPFIFRAWPSVYARKPLDIVGGQRTTNWGTVHVPQKPDTFYQTIRTKPLGQNDMRYMLHVMTGEERFEEASIPERFAEEIRIREPLYAAFEEKYKADGEVRAIIGAAISITCDEMDKKIGGSRRT